MFLVVDSLDYFMDLTIPMWQAIFGFWHENRAIIIIIIINA